jgi:hypothetical protein
MNIGDRVSIVPQTFGNGTDKPGDAALHARLDYEKRVEPQPGTVTYIHPSGRWYQVTFDVGIKECFFVDVEPVQLAKIPVNRSRNYGGYV